MLSNVVTEMLGFWYGRKLSFEAGFSPWHINLT